VDSQINAATKFFHAHANACQRKRFIRLLKHEGRLVTSKEGKADVAFTYIDDILGSGPSCSSLIALEHLGLPHLDTAGLVESRRRKRGR
jgi:hypothetical protein